MRTLNPLERLLYTAVAHTLNRVQTDPDLAYLLLDTETFDRLVEAEANTLELETPIVKERRMVDKQPRHRARQPLVVEQREQITELSNRIAELESQLLEARA